MSTVRRQNTARAGRAIIAAIRRVHDNPGCSKAEAARAATPGQPVKSGYAAVNRAIRLGLLGATGTTRRYHLYVTPLGYQALDRDGGW